MHLRSRRVRLLAAATALLAPVGVLAAVQPAAAAPTKRVDIESTLPRWLPRTKGRVALAVPEAKADQHLTVRIYLAPRGGDAALTKAVQDVSTPGSAAYGQFLSADAYHAAYAPTAAAEKSVRSYLTGQGLTVTGAAPFRRYLTVEGSVAELDQAFDVSLKQLTHDGQHVVAPTTAASLPASVAAHVLTVSGLDTTQVRMTHRHTPAAVEPPAGFRNARPCSAYYGQVLAAKKADYRTPLLPYKGRNLSYAVCGYTGSQLRSAYGVDASGLDGSGATVAITDAYSWPLIAEDASRYASEHGDAAYAAGQLTLAQPVRPYNSQKDCDPTGWSGEETLDVEAVHAMAPAAGIRYYPSASCNDDDFLDTLAKVADDDVVQAVTNSWGDLEEVESSANVVAYETVFKQAALQGISVMFSSGDDGDEVANSDLKQTDYPASDPYVTAVGGTATAIDGDGKRSFDAGWGTNKWTLSASGRYWLSNGFVYGAGGGASGLFDQPSYQRGVVPSQYGAARAVPDVALDADPTTGMLVGQTQKFSTGTFYSEYRIGGTSLASPLLAGMTALAVQHNDGRGLGLLNPAIYAPRNRALTTDVVRQPGRLGNVRVDYVNGENGDEGLAYTVRTFGQDSSLPVGAGWDPVTGRGVPNGAFLKLVTPRADAATSAGR